MRPYHCLLRIRFEPQARFLSNSNSDFAGIEKLCPRSLNVKVLKASIKEVSPQRLGDESECNKL